MQIICFFDLNIYKLYVIRYKFMINDFEAVNHLISDFVVKCFGLGVINYNYNLISFDNDQIFQYDLDKMLNKKQLQLIYSDILEKVATNFFIDFIFSFTNTLSINYNSIFTFSKNRPVFYLNRKDIRKKGIHDYNELVSRVEHASIDKDTKLNLCFPFIGQVDEDVLDKLVNWITILNKIMKIERVIIFSVFCFNDTNSETIDKIKRELNLNIIYVKLVDKSKFFNILLNSEVITNEQYSKINMFISPNELKINNINKMIQNPLFIKWKKINKEKNSRICFSLEHISDYEELIKFTNLIGEYIGAIKINSNFIFNETILVGLRRLANHHNFLILDDKKLVLKSMNQLKKINVFNHVDAVSLSFDFMSEEIDEWFKNQRKYNANASFIINLSDTTQLSEYELAKKQYDYFNQYVFGFIDVKENSNEYFSIIEYSKVNNLNDEFKTLRNSDMVVLGEELNSSKNPLEVLQKINKIMND
jgi:hypothetical protein